MSIDYSKIKKTFPWDHWIVMGDQAQGVLFKNRFDCAVMNGRYYEKAAEYKVVSSPLVDVDASHKGSGLKLEDVCQFMLRKVRKAAEASVQLVPPTIGLHSTTGHSIILEPNGVRYRRDWIRDAKPGKYIIIPAAEQVQVVLRTDYGRNLSCDVVIRGRLDPFEGDPRDFKGD
jgi:hypothetical protein